MIRTASKMGGLEQSGINEGSPLREAAVLRTGLEKMAYPAQDFA